MCRRLSQTVLKLKQSVCNHFPKHVLYFDSVSLGFMRDMKTHEVSFSFQVTVPIYIFDCLPKNGIL